MNIGEAVRLLSGRCPGGRVPDWDGKGMSLELQVPDAKLKNGAPVCVRSCPRPGRTGYISGRARSVQQSARRADLLADDWVGMR